MAWWIEKNPPGGQMTLQKAARSPGAGWIQVPGATDSMSEQQAVQVYLQDVASGVAGGEFGYSFPNPFAGIADTAHAIAAIGAFFDDAWKAITDGKMWRSLGWLLLGIVLIFAGAGLLIGRRVPAVPGLPR